MDGDDYSSALVQNYLLVEDQLLQAEALNLYARYNPDTTQDMMLYQEANQIA